MASLGEIKLSKFDKRTTNLSLLLTVTKEFKIRFWIAIQLFKLGAKVLGTCPDIDIRKENEND